ncbi:BRCA1-A complex subunit RAP80 isoform X1 [Coregonus clupeaformis]|uniref:BRCA1-A complex subunit RAP80 isoform X1 n=1 Tax=Coregonus clupeaformis TaxID=59861 RepID=UPI001E1C494B|nr:BRCA1-A complex subunit RAP80 isoform X1 [Coregonus clupeaformis]
MPPRKKRENRDTDDGPRKRRRADDQEEGRVVISDSDEDEDFRPTSSSSREERRQEKESKTRSNEMTEEKMLDLAMRLSKQEASSAALRQQQEEEAMRKAIAESLYADSPTHPHSESLLGAGSPTQQCQNYPPEGESSIRKLSYPNHGVADRQGARGGGVSVGMAPSDRRGKKEGSPLRDMPDLSQTQKVYSQSSPLSQASTSVPLPSSQEEGSSQRNLFGDRTAKAIESQDYNNSTKSDSQSQLRIKSPVFPSTTALQASKPVLCLEKLSQNLLVDCQASGFLLKGHPSLTLTTKSQKSQSYQPKSPTFSNTPVFSRTERGAGEEPGQGSPSFPKHGMFSNSDSGEEEKEASPTVPKSLLIFKTDRGKAEKQGSPTSPKSTMFSKTETFTGSPVFPRTDQIRDQGPQSAVEHVSTTGDYEDGDIEDPPECSSHRVPAVKSRDGSVCLLPRPRTTLSLNKRFVPIRKTAGVSDKVVDQKEREGESSQRTVNRISTPAKLVAEEDLHSEELTLALETQPMQELTSNMALRWSDDDEEENGPAKSAHSPSPVFPQENDLAQPSNQGLSPNTHHCSPPHRHSPCLVPKKRIHTAEDAACEEVESQSKCIRKKFTFKGMYGAPPPCLPRQVAGRGSQDKAKAGSPSSHQAQCSSSRLSPPTDGQGDGGVVRYYWGVPFCPRGQNPDAYTQVILSQLEVYEKSLKEAQRGLLRKAGWGEPVLPGPPERPFSRRGRPERHRASRLLEEEERGEKRQEELVEVVEDDEEEGEKRERRRSRRGAEGRGRRGRQEWKDCQALFVSSPEQEEKSPSPVFHADSSQLIQLRRRLSLRREEKRLAETQLPDLPEEREEDEKEEKRDDEEDGEKREEEEEEVDVGGLEVQETQLSDDSTQDLMVTSPEQPQPESQSLPRIQTFLSSPRTLEQREEGMLVVGEEEEGRRSGPVVIPAVGEDVRMEEEGDIPEPAFPQSPSPSMDCPMCMHPFCLTEIEMHAAYCDGTTDIMEEEMAESHLQVSVKARRKRTRRGEIIGEEQPSSSGAGNRVVQGEKCFLCQQLFPLKDHEKHVEDCFRDQEVSKAAPRDGQVLQSGDLLSALDQTEHRDSGTGEAEPCDTTFNNQQSSLIDDLDTAESGGSGDFATPGFRVSTSPIQSFTPVSEATDCLIDFKRQCSSSTSSSCSRPSQRGRLKR